MFLNINMEEMHLTLWSGVYKNHTHTQTCTYLKQRFYEIILFYVILPNIVIIWLSVLGKTLMLEKTLESPLDCKDINLVLKEINPEYSLERQSLKLKILYFGHLMQRWLTGKDLILEKDWGQEEKGMTEYELVGWYHWFNGHEFEQAPGHSEGQGSLALKSMGSQRVGNDWVTE